MKQWLADVKFTPVPAAMRLANITFGASRGGKGGHTTDGGITHTPDEGGGSGDGVQGNGLSRACQ